MIKITEKVLDTGIKALAKVLAVIVTVISITAEAPGKSYGKTGTGNNGNQTGTD